MDLCTRLDRRDHPDHASMAGPAARDRCKSDAPGLEWPVGSAGLDGAQEPQAWVASISPPYPHEAEPLAAPLVVLQESAVT